MPVSDVICLAKMPGLKIATAMESPKITTAKIVTATCGIELATTETTIIINDTRITLIHSQKLIKHFVHFFIESPPSACTARLKKQ